MARQTLGTSFQHQKNRQRSGDAFTISEIFRDTIGYRDVKNLILEDYVCLVATLSSQHFAVEKAVQN